MRRGIRDRAKAKKAAERQDIEEKHRLLTGWEGVRATKSPLILSEPRNGLEKRP
jgi:hypothetical protein